MMLHTQFLQPTWPDYSLMESQSNEAKPHEFDMVAHMGNFEFSSSFPTTKDYSDILSSSNPYFSTNYFNEVPTCSDNSYVVSPLEENELSLDGFDHMSNGELFVGEWIGESWEVIPLQNQYFNKEDSMISSTKSGDVLMLPPSPDVATGESIEIDNEAIILHLLKAYGEALEMGSIDLAEVILQRLREKVSPVGATMERVGYYLFRGVDNQTKYLKKESSKNYEKAFRAFYEICPYGRFAHFVANMAILEAVPEDAQTVHILDFDMGEGVQWPPLLEALGRHRMVRLTSIARRDDQVNNPQLKFEVTKNRLCNYARSQGLMLKVEELYMDDLLKEKKRMKRRGEGKEWMAFNCMVGLPHMLMGRSRKHAWGFIRAAKELISISNTTCSNICNRGIIVFGSGDGVEIRKGKIGGFEAFFDGCLLHFNALFKSMEWHIPNHLSLARTAMECLFVGPYVSSFACYSKWEERHEAYVMHLGMGLKGWRLSQENLMEAKEMVREGENLYKVRIAGERENEMVLEWRGTPLVRVYVWR